MKVKNRVWKRKLIKQSRKITKKNVYSIVYSQHMHFLDNYIPKMYNCYLEQHEFQNSINIGATLIKTKYRRL